MKASIQGDLLIVAHQRVRLSAVKSYMIGGSMIYFNGIDSGIIIGLRDWKRFDPAADSDGVKDAEECIAMLDAHFKGPDSVKIAMTIDEYVKSQIPITIGLRSPEETPLPPR